jgi:hypothetical protein
MNRKEALQKIILQFTQEEKYITLQSYDNKRNPIFP